MARQVSEVTQQEVDAYAKFAQEHNIIHDDSADDQANAELVLNYFCNTWPNVISHQTLTQAYPMLKPHLRFKSAARLEAEKAARENSTISRKFADWFDNQNILVREGDDGYLNFAQLLRELRGREITVETIHQGLGRISYRPGRQLAYVEKERKQVDPSYKPGMFITDYNVTPGEHQRRLRASQRQEQESQETRSTREQATAKHEAEKLRSGYSHAEDEQVSKLFVNDPQTREINWIATKNARLAMLQRFANRRTTRFLVS